MANKDLRNVKTTRELVAEFVETYKKYSDANIMSGSAARKTADSAAKMMVEETLENSSKYKKARETSDENHERMLEIIRIFNEKNVSLVDEIKELAMKSPELKNAPEIISFVQHRMKIQNYINTELIKRLQQ